MLYKAETKREKLSREKREKNLKALIKHYTEYMIDKTSNKSLREDLLVKMLDPTSYKDEDAESNKTLSVESDQL